MNKTPSDVGDIAVGDHTWTYEYVEGNGRHYWYRRLADAEVREHSDGRFEDVDDIDIQMASPPDYPVYSIELVPHPSGNEYEVTVSRTVLAGTAQSAMRTPIGGEYIQTRETMSKALQEVKAFARQLS